MNVSAVIRARNEAANLRVVLASIHKQALPEATQLEAIVVDNESDDDSCLVASEFGAVVVPITKAEFSWGAALNRGIAKARGEIVVILSADAHPADSHWLSEMIKPLSETTVGAVYGRQEPRRDAPIDERARLSRTFGESSCVLRPGDEEEVSLKGAVFISNACAAIRRRCWEELPYDEKMRGAEERVWTKSIMSRGYSICYQAGARVYHSHRDTIRRHVWREWELFYQQIFEFTGRKPTMWRSLYRACALGKRRVINCLNVPGHCRAKMVGMLRLPIELALFFTVSLFCRGKAVRQYVRPMFWG